MEAETEEVVNQKLRQQQLSPVKVAKRRSFGSISFGSGVTVKDLVTFTRLFATMIDAGLPLVQCLDILAGQQSNQHFREGAARTSSRRSSKACLQRGLAPPSQGLRRALRQSGPRRRDGRHPRQHHAASPRFTSRSGRSSLRQVRGALHLPFDRGGDRGRRDDRAAHLRHPGLRRHVQGLRRRTRELPFITRAVVDVSKAFISFLPITLRRSSPSRSASRTSTASRAVSGSFTA